MEKRLKRTCEKMFYAWKNFSRARRKNSSPDVAAHPPQHAASNPTLPPLPCINGENLDAEIHACFFSELPPTRENTRSIKKTIRSPTAECRVASNHEGDFAVAVPEPYVRTGLSATF